MSDKPVPTWVPFGLIAASVFLFYNAYQAWKSDEIRGRRTGFLGKFRYYDRATRPVMFWFTLILWLVGASICLIAGLRQLLTT